jgi:hypothetical protein
MQIECPECRALVHKHDAPEGESTKRCDCGAFVATHRVGTLTTVRAYRRSLGWLDPAFSSMPE